MEGIINVLNGASEIPSLAVIKVLCNTKPGLKDNNFQVLGQKVNAIKLVAEKGSVFSQQSWDCLTPELIEKLSDAKNAAAIKETLCVIAEKNNFCFVFNGVVEFGLGSKSPKVKSETLSWISEGLVAFGLSGIQPKLALDSIKKGLSDSNPAVRTNAINLLGVMHWYIGASVRRVFEDEKSSILSTIDAEIAKYDGKPIPPPTRGKKKSNNEDTEGGDEEDEEEAAGANEIVDLVPRSDISSKITDSLLEKMGDKNWKIRKEGMDELKEILNSAKFITANVGGLPAALNSRFGDSNKIICIQAVEIAKDMVVAMGPHVKQHIPTLLPGLCGGLSDSKPNVRNCILSTMEALLEQSTLKDFFVNEVFATALTKGNPFVKQEIFGFLAAKLPDAKAIPKDDLAATLPVLFASIEDRSADVRKTSQEAIPGIMKHLGYNKMRTNADKLKATSKNTVIPLLDKARETLPAPAPKSAPTAVRGGQPAKKTEDRPATGGGAAKKPSSATKSRLGMVAQAATANRKKTDADADNSPPYVASNLKNTRFKEESKLKVLKWNFSTPRQEFVDQLRDQMTAANFNKTLMTQMFHSDFKQHLKVIETLSKHLDNDLEGLIANLDLILKWMTLRFYETSPSVLLKGLEYLNAVFNVLADDSYTIHDVEAVSFIPYLINKVGDPKDQVRNSIRTMFKSLTQVYAANKFVNHLMNGLSSKNAKQRAEILEELGYLIKSYGTSVLQPSPPALLKEIAKQISDRDNGVRSAALNTITEVYFKDGERMYKVVGNLPEKDMAMLEERIKRSLKNRPPPGSANQPPPPQPIQQQPAHSSKSPTPSSPVRSAKNNENNIYRTYSKKSAQNVRPVSGPFQLNYEEIETGNEANMSESLPRLLAHDLDDILDDGPVVFPQIRTRLHGEGSPQPYKPLTGNQEAYEALDVTLAQVFSPDTKTSLGALSELSELIKDDKKVILLHKRVDQLFVACYTKYRHVLFTMMPTDNCNKKDVIKLFHYITVVLLSAYHRTEITTKASLSSLHDLIHVILSILIEPNISEMSGGPPLIRALNVLTVKIVERSGHTNITCAFLKLLRESVANRGMASDPTKFVDIVMKCLWKIIKCMNDWVNEDLQIELLLAEVHEFLKLYPSSFWKRQESDTPMRTVKTIIHVLATLKGNDILNHLGKVSDPQNSELLPYLHKLLNNGVGGGSENKNNNHTDNNKKSNSNKNRFTKTDHETLADIFEKIGQKELTKQGLEELYNFKQQNPDADIEPFLSKSSQYFRDYIERGLKNIEMEVNNSHRRTVPQPAAKPLAPAARNNGNDSGGGGSDVNTFLERLKRLRADAGLDNAEIGQENIATTQNKSDTAHLRIYAARKPEVEPEVVPPPAASSNNSNRNEPPQLEDIRKRLDRIKHSAF